MTMSTRRPLCAAVVLSLSVLVAAGAAHAARDKLEPALAMLQARQGPDHPRTREASTRLIDTYQRLGMEEQAAALQAEAATATQ